MWAAWEEEDGEDPLTREVAPQQLAIHVDLHMKHKIAPIGAIENDGAPRDRNNARASHPGDAMEERTSLSSSSSFSSFSFFLYFFC